MDLHLDDTVLGNRHRCCSVDNRRLLSQILGLERDVVGSYYYRCDFDADAAGEHHHCIQVKEFYAEEGADDVLRFVHRRDHHRCSLLRGRVAKEGEHEMWVYVNRSQNW